MQWFDTLTGRVKRYALLAALAAVSVLLLFTATKFYTLRGEHQALQTKTATADAARSEALLKNAVATGTKQATHATATQKASDAFTQTATSRSDSLRADLDRAERLRAGAESRAATYRAMSRASAAAGRAAADRLIALDGQLVEGVAVVAELRSVVAKRDAEVVLLRGTIDADRELLAP